jgi:hypothetical protein
MKPIVQCLALAGWILGAVGAGGAVAGSEAGYLYLSPVPRSCYVPAQTRYVLVRFAEVTASQVTNLFTSFITVSGSASGVHLGVTRVAGDGRTVIHELSGEFVAGERVTVSLDPRLASPGEGLLKPYAYPCMIEGPMAGSLPPNPVPPDHLPSDQAIVTPASNPIESTNPAAILPNGVAVPSGFPKVLVSVKGNPSPGHIFLDNAIGLSTGFSMLVDNNGWPVWYTRGRVLDLKLQANGLMTRTTDHGAGFDAFDADFNPVRTYLTVNGFLTDAHDLKVLANGSYLVLGYRYHSVDLSRYILGASTNATVRETVLQEFTNAGELIFQWRSWDHYKIWEVGQDFTHMNALDIDEDGHILVSCRQLSEVTKIHRDTGEILWRLGGLHGDFVFTNDPLGGLSFQHAIRALGNRRYLVFDNGNTHSPQVSRAVEYQLDLTNWTATLVWEFRDTPDKYAFWMGNAERLATGNTLINFVRPNYPSVIEVDASGVKQLEMTLVPNAEHYRTHRFLWNGAVAVPYLIAERAKDSVTLVFNKFGDRSVAHYRIYGGVTAAPTNLLATSTAPLKRLTNIVNGVRNYFRITAVDTNGVESGFSNEESLRVNLTLPGSNLLFNGDFAQGTNDWIWQVRSPASAQWTVAGGISRFQITSGGTYITDIQLKRVGIGLIQGKQYTLEFDAWSAVPRIFEAKVEQDIDFGINYSGTQPFTITPVSNHYSFTFTMQAPSDYDVRVVFNAGVLPHDVYLDNVSLVERVYPAGDFDYDGRVEFDDLRTFTGDWQSQGPGGPDLNGDGKVDFADFVLFSRNWSGVGSAP